MDADASTVFDSLPELERSVSEEMKANLFYISGYVTIKLHVEGEDYDDTYSYYEKYGRYLASLNRGGLKVPQDSTFQWVIFCYLIFDVIKTSICRSLMYIFQQVSDTYNLNTEEKHCVALANILINNFCKASTPLLRKEVDQKVIIGSHKQRYNFKCYYCNVKTIVIMFVLFLPRTCLWFEIKVALFIYNALFVFV